MARTGGWAIAAAAAATIALQAATGAAQTLEERVGGHRDWSVYEHGGGANRVCWVASTPKRWEARRGGSRVQVRRGEIFFNVAVRPGQGVANEASFIAGYPLDEDQEVRVSIGDDRFQMFSEGETAWLENTERDDDLVAAMRRGLEAEVRGVSTRGTTTIDTFSLLGFTAALEDARALCGG